MTTPLIVVTVEGGVIQDISVSLQARVIIVDHDHDDYSPEKTRVIDDRLAAVCDHGVLYPSEAGNDWLKTVLLTQP